MATPLIRSVKANGNKLAIEFAGLVDTSGLEEGFTIDADGTTIEITNYSHDPSTTLLTLEADTDFPADYRLIYDGARGGIKLVAEEGSLGPFQAVFQSQNNNYELAENHFGILIEGSAGGLQGFASSEEIRLVGNSSNNELRAVDGEAAVTLDGGAGADNLIGGAGDNTYIVDNVDDVVTEIQTAGTATVESSVSYSLGDNVDNLTLTGTGNIDATGNTLANELRGNDGNNVLTGGVNTDPATCDTLIGGNGNDTYIVSSATDVIQEFENQGTDTVNSSTAFSLTGIGNVENLTLTGNDDIGATGNSLANVLTGNDGNNNLTGGTNDPGQAGDTLIGGKGNDTYFVSNTTDIITEGNEDGSGTDTVQASVSYTLANNVENLTLTSTAKEGTGNAQVNIIKGNSEANILDGKAGADTLEGSGGNDTYIVDDASDKVIEDASQDIDTIKSTVSYTLANNVENLTLTGTGNIDATGNTLANVLTGNDGNNVLSGVANDAGLGGDTLIGGKGNDTYIVSSNGDDIVEKFNEGTDTVKSSAISFTLKENLENLTFTGTSDFTGIGNTLSNVITGGDGNDSLTGGLGNDSLTGGLGNDTFNVDSGSDTITDLSGSDVLNVYAGATANATVSANFKATMDTINQGTATLNSAGKTVDLSLVTTGKGYTVNNTSATAAKFTGSISSDNLTGGTGIDTLDGGVGDDSLTGKAGDDQLTGGDGNDTFNVDAGTDTITDLTTGDVLNVSAGATANATVTGTNFKATAATKNLGTATLNSAANIVDLAAVTTGKGYTVNNTSATPAKFTGSKFSDNLTGGTGIDTLDGGAGDDSLTGGLGNDLLTGGLGNDTFNVDAGTDTINDLSGSDVMNVSAGAFANATVSANFMATAATKNLGTANLSSDGKTVNLAAVTTGSGYKVINKGAAATFTGSKFNDNLTGGEGNDSLTGGLGNDSLTGDLGNDTFNVDAGTDTINDLSGSDVLNVSAGATANATVTGAGFTATAATKNLGTATLNSAGNIVDLAAVTTGKGYTVNNTSATPAKFTGSKFNDNLTGGGGEDTLDGGKGADTLTGRHGNDKYTVDNVGDKVVEFTGEGVDTVCSTISYKLGDNLENLTLTGSSNINATGNGEANTLTGNSGNNILTGGAGNDTLIGGRGIDKLTGGTGADTFRLNDPTIDRISDFAAEDTIEISRSGVLGAGSTTWTDGTLGNGDFRVVSTSAELTTALNSPTLKFVYYSGTGDLHQNVNGDGNGPGSDTVVANLSNRPTAILANNIKLIA